MKPTDARTLVQQAIPPSVGRPQTIVVPDDATNSLTVRDTAENVRLIGDLLQSIDKDRAEVVMDVNIYEVSKSDFLQWGNQIGTGTDFTLGGFPGFSLLSDAGVPSGSFIPGVNLGALVGGVPTALAAALVIPPSAFRAYEAKTTPSWSHQLKYMLSTVKNRRRELVNAFPFRPLKLIHSASKQVNQQLPTGFRPVASRLSIMNLLV